MDNWIYVIMFLLAVFISSCAQIIFKKKAMQKYNGIYTYFNIYVLTAYAMFFLSSLCAVWLYKYIPLSTGTLLDASGYVYVVIFSAIFLNEKITLKKFIGVTLIAGGVCLCVLL